MPIADHAAPRDGLAFRGRHWRLWVSLDGVVRLLIEGDHDLDNVQGLLEAFGDVGARVRERPVRVLVYAHRPLSLQPDARERIAEACKAHPATRVAVVRASPLARIQAKAIMRRAGMEFGFFDNEPEAVRALGGAEVLEAPPPAPPRGPEPHVPDVGFVDIV
jgi:hypothetical protein